MNSLPSASPAPDNLLPNSRFVRRPIARQAIFPWEPGTKGIWNASDPVYYELPRNQYSYFRRTFELEQQPEVARLRILVDTRYKLYCNGSYVGRGPSRFDPRDAYYDVYELAPLLRPGRNVIAVFAICHGYGTGSAASVIQVVIAQLDYGTAGGVRHSIGTDQTWKAQTADAFERATPRINGRLGPMEVVHVAKLDPRWCDPDYDDGAWQNCAVLVSDLNISPWFNFLERDIPQLHEAEHRRVSVCGFGSVRHPAPAVAQLGKFLPKAEWESGRGALENPLPLLLGGRGPAAATVVNLDFGETLTGYLSMVLDGDLGDVVDAYYCEVLRGQDVPLQPHNSRVAADRFILRRGENSCEVSFGWKGFRYAQLRVWSARPVVLQSVSVKTVGYPISERGDFRCSDRQLDELIAMSDRTVRLCMQDGHLDSPSREQQQWMDCWRQALAAAYYFNDTKLWRRLLAQIAQSQASSGALFPRHPGRHENISVIPLFALYWVHSLAEYLRYTGDDGMLADLWPNAVQALRWFSAFENHEGLLEAVPHWMFMDWGDMPNGAGPELQRDGVPTGLNIAYHHGLNVGAELARQVGDAAAEQHFTRKAAALALAIDRRAWDDSLGAYADSVLRGERSRRCSGATNAFALQFLPLAESRAARIIDRVFEHPIPEACSCSPGYVLDLSRGLRRFGREDLSLRIIREKFGPMMDAGASTTWEAWNVFEQDSEHVWSASHGFGGAGVLMFFVESIVGVGFVGRAKARRYRFAPRCALVPEFSGRVFVPDGVVAIEWTWNERHPRLKLAANFPIVGELTLPGAGPLPLRSHMEIEPHFSHAHSPL